jgi:hypothetical protein
MRRGVKGTGRESLRGGIGNEERRRNWLPHSDARRARHAVTPRSHDDGIIATSSCRLGANRG